jgi:very-short-patch-repair endonuclease
MRGEAEVARIGGRRHGSVPVAMSLAAGVTHRDLNRLRERGLLISVARGLDRLRDHPFDRLCRYQCALDLAGPGAVVGLRTAARLHGFYAFRDCDLVEVLIPRATDHRTVIGRVVQTRWLPPEHVCVVDGFPVTTPARTFFDLCGDPEPGYRYRQPAHERRMIRTYNDAVGRRGLTFVAEAMVLSVLARRGRRGVWLIRRLLRRFGPAYKPTRSDVETMFFEFCRDRGLPEPEKQVAVSGPRGFIGVVDFLWPKVKHIVEVDSSWHDGPLDKEEDAERDRLLEEAGYTVDRYRFGHLVLEPDRLCRELGAATSQ